MAPTKNNQKSNDTSLGQEKYCHFYLFALLVLLFVAVIIVCFLFWKYMFTRTYRLLQTSDIFTRISERMRWGSKATETDKLTFPKAELGKVTTGGNKPAKWAANNQIRNFLEIAGPYKSKIVHTTNREISVDIQIVQNAHQKCPHPSKYSFMTASNFKPLFGDSLTELRTILKETAIVILKQKGVDVTTVSRIEPLWSIPETMSEALSISNFPTETTESDLVSKSLIEEMKKKEEKEKVEAGEEKEEHKIKSMGKEEEEKVKEELPQTESKSKGAEKKGDKIGRSKKMSKRKTSQKTMKSRRTNPEKGQQQNNKSEQDPEQNNRLKN